MSDRRDEELGAALRALDTPPHAPDFFPRLLEQLRRDDESARRRRAPLRSPRRPFFLVGAVAAVAAAILAVSLVLPGSDRPGRAPNPFAPRLATATEVRQRVASALASAKTLRGEITLECAVSYGPCLPPDAGGRTTLRWSFVATAAGDERFTGIGQRDELAYSAERGEQRSVQDAEVLQAEEVVGLPPGPPDFLARPSVLRREFGSVVRTFLSTTGDAAVAEVEVDGRPAWRLVVPVEPNQLAGPGGSGDQLDIAVDRQTGFPLRATESLGGRFLHELRLSRLEVDAPVDPSSFRLELPPGVRPFRQDAGFRRTTLDEATAVLGYQPLLPRDLPEGFQLAQVTVARQSGPTGNEAANPPGRSVLSVAYRRGFDRIVATTRLTGRDPSAWADPLGSGEGNVDRPERFTVGRGALAGARAELVVNPRGVPHVWSLDGRLVVTVAGDATADELRRMIESF